MLKLYKIDYISLELIGYTSITGALILYVSDKAQKFKLKIKTTIDEIEENVLLIRVVRHSGIQALVA